jgi:uncharacterized cupredoxin-like copper-binding protein
MRFILSVCFIAISILLASCGGTSTPTTEIDVTLTDFQFSPSSFRVPAGKEITLNANNSGAVIHNFMIMNLGQTAGPEIGDEDLSNVYWKLEIPPGGDSSTTFTAPEEPGDYEVVCSIAGHIQAGMVGKLTVVEIE